MPGNRELPSYVGFVGMDLVSIFSRRAVIYRSARLLIGGCV